MRFNWVAQYRLGLAFVTVVLFMSIGMVPGIVETVFAEQMKNHQDQQKSEPQQLTIILERIYLDGEMSEEVVLDSYWSIENFWAKYEQWQLVDMDESTMVFRKQVDDISPLLKTNGYFGITDDGVLTIYNGRPDPSRIIQSFFQIDVKKLESKKQEELIQGIPIKTRDRYVEVLETFKPYSMQE
ncbi:forespore regulator of the sigma-K checkpoint [Bacillus niacini]|uniref:Forespore regulator of the sigma-K checkpoint n=1 Tax=Neobacillus niacini TaxID=86668 RepID=A0A852TAF1_9BACI|nr:intercompartmental signaling factor BofC [Neobacillus niacini]NYE05181.1 forespore regulator of the sigma-K checkpoint [Neobacillus niacini]